MTIYTDRESETQSFSFYRPHISESEWTQNGKMPTTAAVAFFSFVFEAKTATTNSNVEYNEFFSPFLLY